MSQEKNIIRDMTAENYDASDQPFDFVEEGRSTAMICEPDDLVRSRASNQLKELGFLVTEVKTSRDALIKMRYHIYDVIMVNELFDCVEPDSNLVLAFLEELPMQVRRRIFVVLTGCGFRTMDNMTAFNRSVNLTINLDNMEEAGDILSRGVAENQAFYQVFIGVLERVETRY